MLLLLCFCCCWLGVHLSKEHVLLTKYIYFFSRFVNHTVGLWYFPLLFLPTFASLPPSGSSSVKGGAPNTQLGVLLDGQQVPFSSRGMSCWLGNPGPEDMERSSVVLLQRSQPRCSNRVCAKWQPPWYPCTHTASHGRGSRFSVIKKTQVLW